MPALSLVVCVFREREVLERLLRESAGCYDELVVAHDVPDTAGVRSVVESAGGRFFETPPASHQEPHWPFAWQQAKHDWILRLDADEFPSEEMKTWLKTFRQAPEPDASISGFTCIWPLWNGRRTVTKRWPDGRNFLINRQRVRFFGMSEQVPIPDGTWQPLPLVLHHQPRRKSYGLHNILRRPAAYRWRGALAKDLMGKPTDLACWRWTSPEWPGYWEVVRQHPIKTAFARLLMFPQRTARGQWRAERKVIFGNLLDSAVHHFLICLSYWWQARGKHRS